MTQMESTTMSLTDTLAAAAALAEQGEVFTSARAGESELICTPADCEGEADYRIGCLDGELFVLWTSPDRYLSQSIEGDLMWTGDDLDDCIDEELVDQGWTGGSLGKVEHFRDECMRYVFRSLIPVQIDALSPDKHAGHFLQCLLAYEATFRELGDMTGDKD
jgi:hypothetical protein